MMSINVKLGDTEQNRFIQNHSYNLRQIAQNLISEFTADYLHPSSSQYIFIWWSLAKLYIYGYSFEWLQIAWFSLYTIWHKWQSFDDY